MSVYFEVRARSVLADSERVNYDRTFATLEEATEAAKAFAEHLVSVTGLVDWQGFTVNTDKAPPRIRS